MPKVRDVISRVKPTEARQLPERFDLAHAIAFFLHDQLARLVVDLEATGALSVRRELNDGEAKEIAGLEGEDLWLWLRENGHEDIISDLTYRQLTAAVVSDASHFLCESLLASGKGKTQVAYALLRKPLKENLLLLEWLAAAPEKFLDRFNGESVWPYLLNRLSKEERQEILAMAASLVDVPGVDEEFLWTLRYAKEYHNSLETLWTKATHLVTHVAASATEPGNLNFVFSTASAVEEQWEHYYKSVPLALFYFVAVAEEVASRFVEWDEDLRPIQVMLRSLALIRYADSYLDHLYPQDDSAELFAELRELGFDCVECDEAVTVETSEVDRFWLNAEMRCEGCGRVYSIWDILKDQVADAANGT